ncbi:hypothetical protein IT415_02490 [bacterium]|nr:hypothetical protein [bacterium]
MSKKASGHGDRCVVTIHARKRDIGNLRRRIEAAFRSDCSRMSIRPGDGWLRVTCQPEHVEPLSELARDVGAQLKVV